MIFTKANLPLAATLVLLVSLACSGGSEPSGGTTSAVDLMSVPAEKLAGVVKPLPSDAAAPERQVFRYLAYEPNSLDVTMTIYESGGSPFVFERLTMLNHEEELAPGAADSWEVSPDGKTWTFHLHPGARWSDGHPVTAGDFDYSFKRMLNPDSGNVYAFFYYDIKGARAYNQRANTDVNSVGIRATDDLTLVIETEKPCAYLPQLMQFPTSSPVPKWQVEKYGTRWTEAGKCVSNAVYQLDEWLTGKYMSFTLNPYYSGNNPTYLRKVYRVFNASVSNVDAGGPLEVVAYDNNEVDVAAVPPTELPRLAQDPRLHGQLSSFDSFTTYYLFFQTRQPPFNNLQVRQAFAHAIDKEGFVRVALHDRMLPAHSMLPPHFPGYSGEALKGLQGYDAKLARHLLAEAGYPGGNGFPELEMWLSDAGPGSSVSQAAQAIQSQLKENLNITVQLRNVERTTYRNSLNNWVMPLSIIGFNYDYPDPHSMLGAIWRSQPRGFGRHDWQNANFDALIDEAAGELDNEKRQVLYADAEKILVSDVGGGFLWHVLSYQLRKPWIKGLKQNKWGNKPYYPNHTSFLEMYIGQEAPELRL